MANHVDLTLFTRKDILRHIKSRNISSKEGLALLKAHANNISSKEKDYISFQISDIAVIGISGRFPGAGNLYEYWENLKAGRDSISEIPKGRWKEGGSLNEKERSHVYKLGGFLSDIDQFDPLFFNISPKEAETMDPQQRLFLQESWHALEDAGYSPDAMDNKKCGVFVGYNFIDYTNTLEHIHAEPSSYSFTGNAAPILAGRISYILNLKGPGIAINTACSSSLVAVHLACESIAMGTSDIALAGGVQTLTSSQFHTLAGGIGMLSPDGRCRTFDHMATGFVPGEGVGVVLLKPLKEALKDGDHIYGVIRGSAINQDGKTNGITAPSAPSQTDLESDVYRKFNINPETIGYIEAHGTATKLGDPIEIQALTDSFSKFTDKKQFCAIGTVKTNIGHTLASAGIAGFLKVLLCLKNKQLVPSLHFEKQNPHINFETSPFYVNTKLKIWEKTGNIPRRAAVSAFGFSGTNAHIVVDAYDDELEIQGSQVKGAADFEQYAILLSAKNESRLKKYAENLIAFLEQKSEVTNDDLFLRNAAYTLQVGRKPMEERLAIVISDVTELKEKLQQFTGDIRDINQLYRGNIKNNKDRKSIFVQGKEVKTFAALLIKEKNFDKLCQLWVSGTHIDWERLYSESDRILRRISLPTYPFAEERYWAVRSENFKESHQKGFSSCIPELHPFIDNNVSTLKEQKFVKLFTGEEFFLIDHVIAGQKTLPGVAYIEMAIVSGNMSSERDVTKIKNVVWAKPILVSDKPQEVFISLYPNQDKVDFEVSTNNFMPTSDLAQRCVHCQGSLVYGTEEETVSEKFDVESIKKRLTKISDHVNLYQAFQASGIQYGKSFQVIRELYSNGTEAFSLLELPVSLQNSQNYFILHPSLIDGAFQTIVGLMETDTLHKSYIPFSLGELTIVRHLTSKCYAHATIAYLSKYADVKKYNINVWDEEGKLLLKIKDFSVRAIAKEQESHIKMFFTSFWEESEKDLNKLNSIEAEVEIDKHIDDKVLLFDIDEKNRDLIQNRLKQDVILVKKGETYNYSDPNIYTINPVNKNDYAILFNTINEKNNFPEYIIHLWSQENFINDENTIKSQIQNSFYSLIKLYQTLHEQKINRTIMVLFVYLKSGNDAQPVYEAISGFARTSKLENSKIIIKTIGLSDISLLPDVLEREFKYSDPAEIYYQGNKRYIKSIKKIQPVIGEISHSNLKKDNVYLITGGAGGLGLIFATYLAENVKAKVILTGRSVLNEERAQQIKALGQNVSYIQGDIANKEDVIRLISMIKAKYGKINGIIHSAGVIKDAYIFNKTEVDLETVLSPKVFGTICLDEATSEEPLDLFVLFSSLSSITGNPGQSDYAYANSFMDNFANWRESLRLKQKRNGKTISINWPLWKDGGMRVDPKTEALILKTTGMTLLKSEDGVNAFIKSLKLNYSQIIYIEGDQNKVKKVLDNKTKPDYAKLSSQKASDENSKKLIEKIRKELLLIISKILKVDEKNIDPEEDLTSYGFDSISFTEFANRINDKFKLNVTPVVFFENSTLSSFTQFICEKYHHLLINDTDQSPRFAKEDLYEVSEEPELKSRFQLSPQNINKTYLQFNEPVAIIGMSGVMPQSDNLDIFWQHLEGGNDLITEIPPDRWDWRAISGSSDSDTLIASAKWGGFMSDVDKFDCRFFGISPREAELMDPQQRLFLQIVWKTIEDAGYKASDFSGTKTGLFVGVAANDYAELVSKNISGIEPYMSTGMAHSVLANRISFLLNLHGPSEPIDTACSSSLVAIHRAVEAIHSRSCDMAIAGGVSTMLTPTLNIAFCQAGMLSKDGRCKTFDKNADGYVRGEGVGAILLKPLSKAINDNDHIYAVIKGTAENHGGHAASLTAPNAKAQAAVLIDAYERAGISIDTISYIEAHGTGTSLGDPIEINGLKLAFEGLYKKAGKPLPEIPHCALGSVKTNIGHLETASGIAGIIKVLLSLKHCKLPPNLHFKELNPYINLDQTPFYIVNELKSWESFKDNHGNIIPRRAGVSSFGFGGANAHIVLEEYVEKAQLSNSNQEPSIIVLSAKNEERLNEYASHLADFLAQKDKVHLSDIAYTLQVGREAMEERLAMVASNIYELKDKLLSFAKGEREIKDLYYGNIKSNRVAANLLIEGKAGKAFLKVLFDQKEFNRIAQIWVCGINIDWKLLYSDNYAKRMSLPTYPFAKERYWINDSPKSKEKKVEIKKPLKEECLYFKSIWEESDHIERITDFSNPVLLFYTDIELKKLLQDKLNRKVILIKPGEYFEDAQSHFYEINPHKPDDYIKLFHSLQTIGVYPSSLIQFWPIENFYESHSILFVFYIIKAIIETKTDSLKRIVAVLKNEKDQINPFFDSLSGYARSIKLILPEISISTIELAGEQSKIGDVLVNELSAPEKDIEFEIRYNSGKRYVKCVKPISLIAPGKPQLREKGVYLITGGSGELGFIFARYLAKKYQSTLILTGRSAFEKVRKKEEISKLEHFGGKVSYIQADAANAEDMSKVIKEIIDCHGQLNGIIHAAGIASGNSIMNKTENEFEKILKPKVNGTIVLDELTKSIPLDFFILFSSTSSVLGDFGQCDYAVANRFLDSFAYLREKLREQNLRYGRTISINWPLWKEGGLHMEIDAEKFYLQTSGFTYLQTSDGIDAFEKILGNEYSQVILISGDPERIANLSESRKARNSKQYSVNSRQEIEGIQIESDIKKIAASILKIDPDEIDVKESLGVFGFDSISLKLFAEKLNDTFGITISPTKFFVHGTILSLSSYLIKTFKKQISHPPLANNHELSAMSYPAIASSLSPFLID